MADSERNERAYGTAQGNHWRSNILRGVMTSPRIAGLVSYNSDQSTNGACSCMSVTPSFSASTCPEE